MAPLDPSRLHRPVGEWPLLLAGPIVRRVTASSVAVFLAASESVTVTLKIYRDTDRFGVAVDGDAGVAQSLALGGSLHACVVQKTGLELQPGTLYGYDLEIRPSGGAPKTLFSLGLLDAPVPLGYVAGRLPGFVLPAGLDELRVAHGSCRKSHGCHTAKLEDPDALPIIDRLIELDWTDALRRPQQLFLTGDQIYSDDVPASLLAALTSAGRDLLAWGRPEQFPLAEGGTLPDTDPTTLGPGRRSWFLHDQGIKVRPDDAELWSDFAACHLLFFSEWCAMYLFAWSPELWQPKSKVDPKWPQVKGFHYYSLPPALEAWPKAWPGAPEPRRDPGSPDTTTPALIYAQTLPLVRRALANVATYMILDDHDVTDDWFLNETVSNRLRGRGEVPGPGGRRLMRNALAAYAIFQHWGNKPEDFLPGTPGGRLLDLLDAEGLEADDGTPALGQSGREDEADVILDVGEEPVGVARRNERLRWDYELVFGEHRVIVLDTRTWRAYPPESAPVDADALREAAAQRATVTGDWGPDALETLSEPWLDAASAIDAAAGNVATQLAAFLDSGAELLNDCAGLGRAAVAGASDWKQAANTLVDHAGSLLDAVLEAPELSAYPWVVDGVGAAEAAVGRSEHASAGTALDGTMAVGTALFEAFFLLDEGVSAWLRDVGLDSLAEDDDAFRVAVQALADVLRFAGMFLEYAGVSVARAASEASKLAGAWAALTTDGPVALWGALDEEIEAALAAARLGTETVAPLFDEAAARHAVVDPVWALQDGSSRLNAELISAEALAFEVHERLANTANARELTLVVSPAPVFGHWLVELAQQGLIIFDELKGVAGDESQDNEPWSGNFSAWARFLNAFEDLESVVFLSGDVHYAFSSVNDYRSRGGRETRFVQFTASSAKNATLETRALSTAAGGAEATKDVVVQRLDYLSWLPKRGELPEDIRNLLPACEDAIETTAELAAGLAGARGTERAPLTVPNLSPGEWIVTLAAAEGDEWERLRAECDVTTEETMRAVVDLHTDQTCAIAGDRVLVSPVAREQMLLLCESLGLDSNQLEEVTTTMLADRRTDERSSFALRQRMGIAVNAVERQGRQVVGLDTVGLVSTVQTRLGRMMAHELYYFPLDAPASPAFSPQIGGSFRSDWIVTRHVAGPTLRMPPDGGRIGAR